MKLNIPFLLVISIICIIIASCNRKMNGSPLNNLKFSTITETSGNSITTTRITYNAQGNVDSMIFSNNGSGSNGNGYNKFNYYANSYAIHRSNGTSETIDSVLLKNNDMNCVYPIDRLADTLYFYYNSANEIITQNADFASGTGSIIDSTIYSWGAFDINYSQNTATAASTYYTVNPNLSAQTGDGLRINQFLTYGRTYFNTQHLPLSETYYGNTVNTYLYQFDANGRISQLSVAASYNSGGTLDTLVYVYSYAD